MKYEEIEQQQRALCRQRGENYVPAPPESKLGLALDTLGQLPVNGLRHPPEKDTNGWYLWCGENLSQAKDFFAPLHTKHLMEKCPESLRFLGLPPGCRFLLAGDHVDIWFDSELLKV